MSALSAEVLSMRRLLSIVLTALVAAAILPGHVAAAVPTTVTFATSPNTSPHGTAFTQQPVVQVLDETASPLANAAVTLTIKSGTSGAALTCDQLTVTTDTQGNAAFAGCSIDLAGTYVLTATAVISPDSAAGDSASFGIGSGVASAAAFATQPGNGQGGTALSTQPVVTVEDEVGLPVLGTAVNLAIVGGTGASGANLTCTNSPTTGATGTATFTGCAIDKAGTGYVLRATAASLTTDSSAFDVTVGPAAKLAVAAQPSSAVVAGDTLATTPQIALEDAGGNVVSTDSTTGVAMGLTSAGGATLSGNLTQTASAGVATFGGLSIDKVGSYTLTATSGALTPAQTASIQVGPGAAASLAVTSDGSQVVGVPFSVTVTAHDALGNVATGYAGTVHFTSSDGAAALPADTTFALGDAGTKSVQATLGTAGTQSVTATDTVTASITGTTAPITVSATGSTLQTVNFSISDRTYPVAPFTVAASSTSGLTDFTYSTLTPSVCSAAGDQVTVIAAGSCTVRATQPGDHTYAPALADASFTIAKGSQTITISSSAPTRGVIGTTYTPSATTNAGLPVAVSLGAGAGTNCSLSAGVVTFLGAGSCEVDFNQSGDSSWNAAGMVAQSIQVDATPGCPDGTRTTAMNVGGSAASGCTDADGDPLTYGVTAASHGQVSINASGVWTYTPEANYIGSDSFMVTAADGYTNSAPATISVTVTNSAVVAYPDVVSVPAVVPTAIPVLANDDPGSGDAGQPLTITAVTQGAHGSVWVSGSSVVYDPSGCFVSNGTTDLFTYTASDGRTTSTTAVVVTVLGPGQGGQPATPVVDAPSITLGTGALGSTVPVRVAWCGIVATALRAQSLLQSSNGGASFPSLVYSGTAAATMRGLAPGVSYAWRARTTDTSSRTGVSATSAAVRALLVQDSQTTVVHFGGVWSLVRSSYYSGGTERYATRTSAYAAYTVTGARGFSIVSSKAYYRGSVRIFVDNRLVAVVSERASYTQYKRIIYARMLAYSPTTTHTIVLRPYGNGRVDLDAMVILR